MKKKVIYSFCFFCIVSCSVSNKYLVSKEKCNINLGHYAKVKIAVLSNPFLEVIKKAKQNFIEKYEKKPNVIVIRLLKGLNNPMLDVRCQQNLYSLESDKSIFKDEYFMGCITDKTLVLFIGEENYNLFSTHIKLTTEDLCYPTIYMGNIDTCYQTYELNNDEFILKNSFSAYDYLIEK